MSASTDWFTEVIPASLLIHFYLKRKVCIVKYVKLCDCNVTATLITNVVEWNV